MLNLCWVCIIHSLWYYIIYRTHSNKQFTVFIFYKIWKWASLILNFLMKEKKNSLVSDRYSVSAHSKMCEQCMCKRREEKGLCL